MEEELKNLIEEAVRDRDFTTIGQELERLENERENLGSAIINRTSDDDLVYLRTQQHETQENINKINKAKELIELLGKKEEIDKQVEVYEKEFGLNEEGIVYDVEQLENEIKALDDKRVKLSIQLSDRKRQDHDELEKEYAAANRRYGLLRIIKQREDFNNKIKSITDELGIDLDEIEMSKKSEKNIEPAQDEPTPAEGEPTPAQSEPTPAEGEPAPAEGEPAPAQDEPTPAEGEPAPAKGEPTPAKGEPTPAKAQGESAKAKGESAPAQGESAKAKGKPTPAKAQGESAKNDEEKAIALKDQFMTLPADFTVKRLERGLRIYIYRRLARKLDPKKFFGLKKFAEKRFNAIMDARMKKAMKKAKRDLAKGKTDKVKQFSMDSLPMTQEEFYNEYYKKLNHDGKMTDKEFEDLYTQDAFRTFEARTEEEAKKSDEKTMEDRKKAEELHRSFESNPRRISGNATQTEQLATSGDQDTSRVSRDEMDAKSSELRDWVKSEPRSGRSEKGQKFAASLDPQNGDYHGQDPKPQSEQPEEPQNDDKGIEPGDE